jgi:hypothetical protein
MPGIEHCESSNTGSDSGDDGREQHTRHAPRKYGSGVQNLPLFAPANCQEAQDRGVECLEMKSGQMMGL